MNSEEKRLEPINDTLNPPPNKFGMPWYVILGILVLSMVLLWFPGCRIAGIFLTPGILGFGWWLCREDPKEPQLILHDICLPSEFDPGK